jgi:NADPH:quinone reductase-like Zn-dependent oxidoreductase
MSLPKTQKVLHLPAIKQDYVVATADVYSPGPGELLVKVEAAALNPSDWKAQETGYYINSYPQIMGSDAAGTVVAVGEGITGFQVGDRVYVAYEVQTAKLLTDFNTYM